MNKLQLGNDASIAYQEIPGNKNNLYLLFLHEGLGCIEMWKKFPEQLCELLDCQGIVYERQGYGNSSPLKKKRAINYHDYYALNELPKVISKLLPDSPYFVIGHSDGGTIGLIHASNQPKNLLGVITEAAHVFVEPETIAGIEKVTKTYTKGFNDLLKKYHGEKTDRMFYAWSDTWLSDEFIDWDIQHCLSQIACPLYVMQGKQDQYGTENQVMAIVNQTGGKADAFLINNCDHSPHNEQRKIVLEKMEFFIREHYL
ncbi:MAG: alpha/beta hydrolase [Methylococcales bacterium]